MTQTRNTVMHGVSRQILEQIQLIEDAMKVSGLWTMSIPEWVWRYNGAEIPDIWQWLQFVYLPLCREGKFRHREYLAPNPEQASGTTADR